jgi:hypothetical protein
MQSSGPGMVEPVELGLAAQKVALDLVAKGEAGGGIGAGRDRGRRRNGRGRGRYRAVLTRAALVGRLGRARLLDGDDHPDQGGQTADEIDQFAKRAASDRQSPGRL